MTADPNFVQAMDERELEHKYFPDGALVDPNFDIEQIQRQVAKEFEPEVEAWENQIVGLTGEQANMRIW